MAQKTNAFLGWEIETTPRDQPKVSEDAHPCAHPNCSAPGTFPAPSLDLPTQQRPMLCSQHILEHNRTWDYYANMSMAEIEADRLQDRLWRRVTRPMRLSPQEWVDILKNVDDMEVILGHMGRIPKEAVPRANPTDGPPETVRTALEILHLTWPCTAETAKKNYKKLAQKLHPDVRGSDTEAEEAMKRVNVAYAVIRKFLLEGAL